MVLMDGMTPLEDHYPNTKQEVGGELHFHASSRDTKKPAALVY